MKKVIVYIILIALTTMSCVVYHPHLVDVPLIAKKGDARLNAGISLKKWQATVSAGISDKIAIQTYGSTAGGHQYYVQQAVGYYKDLGNKKVMEVYSGFGYGYGDAYNDANPGHLDGNYQVYFSQLNFGKLGCEFANADLGIALKAGYIHAKLSDNNYYEDHFPPDPVDIYNYDFFLIEPQAFLRLGGKKMKVCLQAGSTAMYKFKKKDMWFPYLPFNLGLGFNYRF